MGRPWSISGKVIQGKKYGRRIGFPTANIKIFNQIKPLFGVYSVKIFFNKKTYKGIANFGVRPTFGSSSPVLEVNVFGKNHNFYNKNIKVLFIDFIRKEKKFNNYKISSSKIRSLIQAGKVSQAHKIMGRPWSISGRVVQGKKFGRRIGFPTANIKIFNQINPLFGVYSVKIIFNKKTYKGIANFGVRPTFGSSSPVLEVNVFGKNHNFYNKNIKVLFIDFIRKEKKFKNSSMLVRQIKKDIKVAKISLNKK